MPGYWSAQLVWLCIVLGISVLAPIIGFDPLHFIKTRMAVEFTQSEPNTDRSLAVACEALSETSE